MSQSISLTYVDAVTYSKAAPAGDVWQLSRTNEGFELRDLGGEMVTVVPAAEATYRIRFPSFFASVTYLEVLAPGATPRRGTYYFKPDKTAVAAIKELVNEAIGIDPAAAAQSLRRKALPALGGGLLALVAGVGVTVATYMRAAAQQGGGRYIVATGLIGVGLFATIRGLAWFARAARFHGRTKGA